MFIAIILRADHRASLREFCHSALADSGPPPPTFEQVRFCLLEWGLPGSLDANSSLPSLTQLCANLAGPVGAAVLRCSATDGLRTLSKLFISLELIYVDADLHYSRVKETLVEALHLFPRALIAGGGWELSPEVQRAVQVGS